MPCSKSLSNKNIVIIDDEDAWVKMISLWVSGYNEDVNIIAYKDYNLFLEEPNQDIDCLVIDYQLQNTTSLGIIKTVRETNKDVLIVCLSGFFTNEDKTFNTEEMKKVLNAGANRVIPKDKEALELILESHFNVRGNGLV